MVWEAAEDTESHRSGVFLSHSRGIWLLLGNGSSSERGRIQMWGRILCQIPGTPQGKTHPELRGNFHLRRDRREIGAEQSPAPPLGTKQSGKVLIKHLLISLAWREAFIRELPRVLQGFSVRRVGMEGGAGPGVFSEGLWGVWRAPNQG